MLVLLSLQPKGLNMHVCTTGSRTRAWMRARQPMAETRDQSMRRTCSEVRWACATGLTDWFAI